MENINKIDETTNKENQSIDTVDLEQNIIILDNIKNITNDETTSNCTCIMYMLGILFILGIIGCVITYIVYVIISLCQTSYNEQKEMCSKSNAWLYLLLGLVVNSIVSIISTKQRNTGDTEKSKKSNYCNLSQITSLAFTIWGCIELFGVNCIKELDHTLLYTMLQVSVIGNIIITGILLLFGITMCCFVLYNEKN